MAHNLPVCMLCLFLHVFLHQDPETFMGTVFSKWVENWMGWSSLELFFSLSLITEQAGWTLYLLYCSWGSTNPIFHSNDVVHIVLSLLLLKMSAQTKALTTHPALGWTKRIELKLCFSLTQFQQAAVEGCGNRVSFTAGSHVTERSLKCH